MHFVLLWKTWFDGEVKTNWDFVLVDHTAEWKPRGQPAAAIIPSSRVDEIMLSMDPERIARFEMEHVHGLVLSTLITAGTTQEAVALVIEAFPDAEIMRCLPVLDQMLPTVREAFERSGV